MLLFASEVCPTYCPWDQKPYIYKHWVVDHDSYTPVPGTGVQVRYDIWSNLHYGYIGRRLGFSKSVLIRASHVPLVAGNPDPKDDAAIKLGFQLYDESPSGVNAGEVDSLVRSSLAELPTIPQDPGPTSSGALQ